LRVDPVQTNESDGRLLLFSGDCRSPGRATLRLPTTKTRTRRTMNSTRITVGALITAGVLVFSLAPNTHTHAQTALTEQQRAEIIARAQENLQRLRASVSNMIACVTAFRAERAAGN